MAGSSGNLGESRLISSDECSESHDDNDSSGDGDSDYIEEISKRKATSKARKTSNSKVVSRSRATKKNDAAKPRRCKSNFSSECRMDLPSERVACDLLQFSQPLTISQESLSSNSQTSSSVGGTSSGTTSDSSDTAGLYRSKYEEIDETSGPIVVVQTGETEVQTFGPLPFQLVSPEQITAADIGKTVFTAHVLLKSDSAPGSVIQVGSETVVFVNTIDDMYGWSGPRPKLVYCLLYQHNNAVARRGFIYLGHKYLDVMVTENLSKSRRHKPVVVICKGCLLDKSYVKMLYIIRERTAVTFTRHFDKTHERYKRVSGIPSSTLSCNSTSSFNDDGPTILSRSKQLELVADFIVAKLLPFTIVEDSTYRRLILGHNPNVECFNRLQVAEYIQQVALRLESVLKDTLHKEVKACCVMSDGWTSRGNEGILATALTYIDSDCRHHTVLLGLQKLTGSHTGVYLASKIRNLLDQFGVNAKCVFSLTDSGSNMLNAMRRLTAESNVAEHGDCNDSESTELSGDDNEASEPFERNNQQQIPLDLFSLDDATVTEAHALLQNTHIVNIHVQHRCIAHSLQSCIRAAVEDPRNEWIKAALLYSRRLIYCCRKRIHISDTLKKLAGKGLIVSVATRWNSHVDTLIRLLEPKVFSSVVAILTFEHEHGQNKAHLPAVPQAEDYLLFQNIVRVLAPFSTATDSLQSDGITVHEVIPEIVHVYHSLQLIPGDPSDVIIKFRDTLIEQLLFRFSALFRTELYLGEMIFTPKRKNYLKRYHTVFPDNPFGAPSQAEATDLIRAVLPKHLTSVRSPKTVVSSALSDDENESVFDAYLNMFSGSHSIEDFWRSTRESLPGLVDMARFFLCVPATTAAVERIFSAAGLICTNLRTRLTLETIMHILRYRMVKLKPADPEAPRKPRVHIPPLYVLQYVNGQRSYKPLPPYDEEITLQMKKAIDDMQLNFT